MQLYDQFDRPIQKKKLPEKRQLAAAPLTDSWREYVTSGLTPERLAAIFKEADTGDMRRQAELFDQMEEKDAHLLGEKGKRQNAILDIPFKVRPASEDAKDAKVAEFVQEYLDGLTDFEDIIVSLQDGVGKGFSCLEIDWDLSEGQALPEKFEFIEQRRFIFTDSTGILRKYPLLITDQDPMGIEIPEWKTLFHKYGGKSGYPTRSGIYRVCAWMYLFKNYSIKDWVVFCEVYGLPLRLGKYDPGASESDKDALITAISSLGSDAAGIISKSTEIEFIENVKGKATGELYQALADFANRETSKALLGQTLSAEVGDKGSYAAAKTHNEVRYDLLKADGRAVAATFRHQLIRPIVGFNFGWDTPCPGYEAVFEEAENLKEKAEWMGSLMDRGMKMPITFVRKEFNIPEPENDEELVGGIAPGAPLAAKDYPDGVFIAKDKKSAPSKPDALDIADIYTGETEDEAISILDELMAPVRKLVAGAKTLSEIRDGLTDLYPDMDSKNMGTLMQRAFAAAELAGRYEVMDGD